MHWLFRIALVIGGNAFALWLAARYIPQQQFVLTTNWEQLVFIALLLALLNFLMKPVLTLILGPIIVITLGLGVIVVNAIIVYALPILANHIDFLRGSITIESIPALLYATLIVSAVNFVIHLIT